MNAYYDHMCVEERLYDASPTMETKGLCDFDGSLSTVDYWLDNMTAHGKVCPLTGRGGAI